MGDRIFVLVDHHQGQAVTPALETLALGQRLAAELGKSLTLVALSDQAEPVASALRGYRGNTVRLILHERLGGYDPDLYCAALKQLLQEEQPYLFLAAHTYQNIDLMPKVAAATRRPLVTSCIGFRSEGENLIFVRQMFRNKLNADLRIRSAPPWLATVQAGTGSVSDLEKGEPEVVEDRISLDGVESRRRSLETVQISKGKVDLSKADVIVAVGRGIKKQENLSLIEELAAALGAEIGASRPVVDSEWLGRERQIGSSGQTVSPRLYVACGISGAIQHVVGMKNAGCIVAINSDPNAPIFNVATYGIVGDLLEVVPALTEKLKSGG